MFRFTIRELLLLTLIVGILFGWWVHYQSFEQRLSYCKQLLNQENRDRDTAERRAEYWRLKYESLRVKDVTKAPEP